MAVRPDFQEMAQNGLTVLDAGLPALPQEWSYSVPVPLAYWKSSVCATVLFFFYFQNEEGVIQPSEISFRYARDDTAWQIIRASHGWAAITNDPISSPESLEYHEHFAIKWHASQLDSGSKPSHPAIVAFGRHAPDVAEIRVLQGDSSQSAPAIGHFGAWIVCSERFEPFRIEALDISGRMVAYLDEPLTGGFPFRK